MAIPKIRHDLAQKLRQLRRKHKWTQEEAAEQAGLDVRHYQKLESNAPHAPTLDTIERLAKAFKISPDKLLKF